jgi:hypothetical protein
MGRASDDVWQKRDSGPRRLPWFVFALFTLLGFFAAMIILALVWRPNRPAPLADAAAAALVTAKSGRLTMSLDNGERLVDFQRRTTPEIWYRVVLEHAPWAHSLELTCEWTDATGKMAHRNQYRTKPVTAASWETHARYRIPADAEIGRWQVRLLLNGRQLHATQFDVK